MQVGVGHWGRVSGCRAKTASLGRSGPAPVHPMVADEGKPGAKALCRCANDE